MVIGGFGHTSLPLSRSDFSFASLPPSYVTAPHLLARLSYVPLCFVLLLLPADALGVTPASF